MKFEQQSPSQENPESLERFKNRESILEQFRSVQYFIEKALDIKLSNIELVGLRKITERVMQEVYEQGMEARTSKVEPMSPEVEIPGRFFQEFYGTSLSDLKMFRREYDKEEFREFFRRKQASLHLP